MKRYRIVDAAKTIGYIEAEDIKFILHGVDHQPNLFNGYHAVELGPGQQPPVLNLPVWMRLEKDEVPA